MLRYIIVRTIWVFIVLFTFLSLLFITLRLVPEFPPVQKEEREIYYTRQANEGFMTTEVVMDPEMVEAIQNDEIEKNNRYFYKDEGDRITIYKPVPVATQYQRWITNIVTEWDWGRSTRIAPNEPVFNILMEKLPITIKINFLALLLFMPVGFTLGVIAALKKNKLTDNIISLGVMIFISIPNFVVMLFLVLIFGYTLKWLPPKFPSSDLTGAIQYTALVLPVLGLSFNAIAGLTRTTRAELTEVLTSDFLLLARTKGLTRRQAVIRHAMRNSMVPLVPGIIFAFVLLLSGSVIIELIYSIPAVGRIYLDALQKNAFDYNMIMALSVFYTSISLFAVLLVDLTYGLVDPRIRMGARK